jgi:hypothetical protein
MSPANPGTGRVTAALIVSILGIPFAFLLPVVGVILGVVGTVLATTAPSDLRRTGQAKAALVCGIAAIVLAIAWVTLIVAL